MILANTLLKAASSNIFFAPPSVILLSFFSLRLGLNEELHDSVIDLHKEILNTGEYAVEAFIFVYFEHFLHLLLAFVSLSLPIILSAVNSFGQTVTSVTELLRQPLRKLKLQ